MTAAPPGRGAPSTARPAPSARRRPSPSLLRGARALRLPPSLPLALLALLAPALLAAQPTDAQRARLLLANGAIGGATAAIQAVVAGKSPLRAFAQGVGGGLLVGAGKDIVSRGWTGSGLVGRQVAALGVSAVASASRDTTALVLPLGPVKLWYVHGAERRWRARVNAAEAVTLASYVARSSARLDAAATLASGAPVFRVATRTFETGNGEALGVVQRGVVLLGARGDGYALHRDRTLAHEMIHVLQRDFAEQAFFAPTEARLAGALPIGARARGWVRGVVDGWLDPGLLGPSAFGALNGAIAYRARPWEQEAHRYTEPRHAGPVLHEGLGF